MFNNILIMRKIALELPAWDGKNLARACDIMGRCAVCSASEPNLLLNLMSVEI